ncbi:MAG: hypothetical protein ISS46_00420 [Candidatus Omnitrophica bacterium]|nr:hypothetical protein [Candidatus Omnitrophota bacterium]
MVKIGIARIDITPKRPVCLAGYFNKRISNGVLDKLYVKVVILEKEKFTLAIITLDLIGLSYEDVDRIRRRLNKRFGIPTEHIIISCTHTHTAPATYSSFEVKKEKQFMKRLIPLIEEAFKKALSTKKEAEIYIAKIREWRLSFNRRYIMKDGSVVTNPPRRSPEIVKPEGPVDNLITSLVFISSGKIIGLLINATNHVDATGGNKISAGWPGHLSRELNKALKGRFPVLVLTGTAGNINHCDPNLFKIHCSHREAQRLGKAYSRYILKSLKKRVLLKEPALSCISKKLNIPYRKVSAIQIKKARDLLKVPFFLPLNDLTSEDLAAGNIVVKRLFAKELLKFVSLKKKRDMLDITVFKIGSLALVGIPGEPFVEIGLAIKNSKISPHIIVTGNTNGSAGYIPLKKHFQKGGYETCTHPYNRFSKDLGERIIKVTVDMLKERS